MSDVLYVQTEKNVEVHQPEVYLQDVAKLSSSSTSVLNRNRVRKVFTVPDGKPGRYVVSALELVEAIQDKEQSVDVTHIGEANFVITYETQKHGHVLWSWMKTALVCFLTFFGGAFSIMTFNMNVDTSGLFFSALQAAHRQYFHGAHHFGIYLFPGNRPWRYIFLQSFRTWKDHAGPYSYGSTDACL